MPAASHKSQNDQYDGAIGSETTVGKENGEKDVLCAGWNSKMWLL